MALACGVLMALPADAQEFGYTASWYVARSTYPEQRDTGLYLFNSVDLAAGPVRASITLPFIRQHTTLLGGLTDPRLDTSSTVTGFGDPLMRVDFSVFQDSGRDLQVGISGSVKPSIVSADDGLGTGATDVAAGATLFKSVGGTSFMADLQFWKYGDPAGIDFPNSLAYGIGIGRVLQAGRTSAMVSLGGFSHGLDGTTNLMQLNAGLLVLASRRQSVSVTAGFSLNDRLGDFSIGTSWRIAR
jgi:hypothetical protein